jgi:hypothetical protein
MRDGSQDVSSAPVEVESRLDEHVIVKIQRVSHNLSNHVHLVYIYDVPI